MRRRRGRAVNVGPDLGRGRACLHCGCHPVRVDVGGKASGAAHTRVRTCGGGCLVLEYNDSIQSVHLGSPQLSAEQRARKGRTTQMTIRASQPFRTAAIESTTISLQKPNCSGQTRRLEAAPRIPSSPPGRRRLARRAPGVLQLSVSTPCTREANATLAAVGWVTLISRPPFR